MIEPLWSIFVGVLVFVMTVGETYIGARWTEAVALRRRRDMQFWAAVFEAVLGLDIYLISDNGLWLVLPTIAGAWYGAGWSFDLRRSE